MPPVHEENRAWLANGVDVPEGMAQEADEQTEAISPRARANNLA